MQQHYNIGTENGDQKLTSSSVQLPRLPTLHIHQQNDNNNTLKKVMSLNCNETRANQRGKNDLKAFNVKYNTYTDMQNKFIIASRDLKLTYEAVKKHQMDSLSDKNYSKFDEPDIIVKASIENIFGIKFPEFKPLLKDHQIFVTNTNMPSELDIISTSGHLKLDLSIKEVYEVVQKIFLEISETNKKYHFWLKMIMEPNEFYDLNDVREYLIQNMFNKEEPFEKLESKLKHFYNNLQLKLINIVNKVDEILKNEKQKNLIKNNDFGNLETNAEISIEEFKQNMNTKLKMLETENENLKYKETEFSKQIENLFGELAFRNQKLIETKDHLSLLMKEKNDLICMIKKMEVKEEGFQTLQNKFSTEKKKNEHLRAIVGKEYETDKSTFVKKNLI